MKFTKIISFNVCLLVVSSLMFTAVNAASDVRDRLTNKKCTRELQQSSPALASFKQNLVKVDCDCNPYCKDPRSCTSDPSIAGPWGVGYQEFLINLGHPSTVPSPNVLVGIDYTFRVAVWFPVNKKCTRSLPITSYNISTSIQSAANGGDTYMAIPGSFLAPVNQLGIIANIPFPAIFAVDGSTLTPARKCFPLIIEFPGAGGDFRNDRNLKEYIASHGFVLIAWYPVGTQPKESLFGINAPVNSATAFSLIQEQAGSLLNWFLDQNRDRSSKFFKTVNANQIAAMGYSRGGAFMQTYVVTDPRIKVLLGTSAGSGVTSFPPAASITLPFIDVHGTSDTNVPIYNPALINSPLVRFPLLGTQICEKDFYAIKNGEHFSPADPCATVQYYTNAIAALSASEITTGIPVTFAAGSIGLFNLQGCMLNQAGRTLINPDLAQPIALNYVVSFAKVFLANDPSYIPFLTKKYLVNTPLLRDNVIYYDGCSTTAPGILAPCSTLVPGICLQTPTPCRPSCPQPTLLSNSMGEQKSAESAELDPWLA